MRSMFTDIQAAPFDDVKATYDSTKYNSKGLRGVRANGLYKEPLEITVEDGPADGLLEVTMTMTWNSNGKTRSLTQVHLLTEIGEG